jgi:type IV pilus assembly protein PilO
MHVTSRDRYWLAGGGLGAVLLLAVAWFLLISPQNGETAGLRDQQMSTEAEITTLRHRLADLRNQQADLPQYQAELSRDRAALPSAPALSDFLRELQAAGAAVGVSVTGMTAGAPAEAPAAGTRLKVVTVSVTAVGGAGALTQFVTQVQQVQPRAALVDSVRLDATQSERTVVLSMTLRVFMAPAAVTPKPSASGG